MKILLKAKTDIPNYRSAGGATTKKCSTCKSFSSGRCSKYDSSVSKGYVCDTWVPNVSAVKKEMQSINEKGYYSFGSTQFNMPVEVAFPALYMGAMIDPEDLHANGVELEPHITLQYGLRDDSDHSIKWICDNHAPVRADFGRLSLFENNPDFDVLKLDVEGDSLRSMNELIRWDIPHTDKWDQYNPHLTIAYLKKGMGRKYLDIDNPLQDSSVVLDELCYSKTTGEKSFFSLRDSSKFAFNVFKDRDGFYRWISRSSTAFKDRDGQYMSMDALGQAVDFNDESGDYGPLRWWHMKGVDLGVCDFSMLYGKTLIESGTFLKEEYGEAIKNSKTNFGVSIGVKHPIAEPVDDTFKNILIFERSIMPSGQESNMFTGLTVKGEQQMENKKQMLKVFELVQLLGPDTAYKALDDARTIEKEAEESGHTFKEADAEFNFETATLEEVVARKEALEAAKAEAEAAEEGESSDDNPVEIEIDMKEISQLIVSEVEKAFAGIQTSLTGVTEKSNQGLQTLQLQLEDVNKRLKGLEGEQPRGSNSYRSTNDPKLMKEKTEKETDTAPQAPLGGVADRIAESFAGHPFYGNSPLNGAGQ
jgi:2'-5' RNA ligase